MRGKNKAPDLLVGRQSHTNTKMRYTRTVGGFDALTAGMAHFRM